MDTAEQVRETAPRKASAGFPPHVVVRLGWTMLLLSLVVLSMVILLQGPPRARLLIAGAFLIDALVGMNLIRLGRKRSKN